MFESLLVANRGEIASRIIRTCRSMGIRTVAVFSDADATAPYVREADESVYIGESMPAKSYLDIKRMVDAAVISGASAIHPGYGFLAESAEFARAVAAAGITWVGPSPEVIEIMGDKVNARNLMQDTGVPVAAGTREAVDNLEHALSAAEKVGYPLMVKASAGGGGIGMAVVYDSHSLRKEFDTTLTRSERFFGSSSILLERWISPVRHVEIQILGLVDGTVLALGDRDCSVQRRHQKVVEEAPAPGISPDLRERMYSAAVAAGERVDYRGVGTIECLVDPLAQEFFFLEMNTRLQVEHPVTELVTGLDLVELQLRVAAGEQLIIPPEELKSRGHAIECRIYAEDPVRFLPSPGLITRWDQPSGEGIRVDAGYGEGDTVTTYYDPLLAKLCTWGETRAEAVTRMRQALDAFTIEGPKVNIPFLRELLDDEEFADGVYDTQIVSRMRG